MLNISKTVKRMKTVKKIAHSVMNHKKEYKALLVKGWETIKENKA